ncbi:MAG: ABC transporter permease [Bacilli bacterium]|nr:ABC transporter permease [Bacilli bacterium]
MLSKLAIRNVKRSIKDYLIYIITVVMAFSLIFAFNFVSFSSDITQLSEMMENLKYAIIFVSCIIVFVIAWLINYTMKFMFEKRSKEFGTYMLLGIEKKDINKMFLSENIVLGLISFVISFFVGTILGNIISAIVMNLFEMPYKIKLSITLTPVLLSTLYFILIYLFTLFRSSRRMKKMKIHNLLYLEKKNEEKIWKKKKYRNILFIIFVILGILGLYLCDYAFIISNDPSMVSYLGISILLLIISIYGITFTLGDFILALINKRRKIKYSKDNLFVAKNFEAKSRTIGFTLGTLSLLITLTLVCMNMSFIMKDAFENNIEQQAPYDILVEGMYSDVEESWTGKQDNRKKAWEYIDYIHENYEIEDELHYQILTLQDHQVAKYIKDIGNNGLYDYDTYLKVSDYNKLLEMLGEKPIDLKENKYFVTGDKTVQKYFKKIEKENNNITINGKQLSLKSTTIENFRLGWSTGNSFLIVIPDNVAKNMQVVTELYAFDTKEETKESDNTKLEKLGYYEFKDGDSYFSYFPVTVRGYYESSNKTAMTIFSFSLLYVSIIFITVVGTILSIQTLSDSNKNKYQYKLLKKLGVEDKKIKKTIRKQITCNFLFPALYPIIIAITTSISINRLFYAITSANMNYLTSILITIGIFAIIYGIYYIATYITFKNNIEE